jgi:hypothetical protein
VDPVFDAEAAENGGSFAPWQAAALLDDVSAQARRTFTPLTPLLWAFRAVLVVVAFGGFWLSVRGQHPYSGPTGAALPVTFALVAVNIGWSALAIRRAGAGVSGPAQRRRRAWTGVTAAILVAGYAFAGPLSSAGANHPAWGLYLASAPMLIAGLAGGVIAAVLRDRAGAGILLAIAVVAAAAGFGGPVGSWLIMGIGLGAVCLGAAAVSAWTRRRSVMWP